MAVRPEIQSPDRRVSTARRAYAVLQLLRPVNLVMFVAGVFVGGFLTAGAAALTADLFPSLLTAGLAVALIGGAGNALNDVLDVEIDRINRPERPMAAGTISRRAGIAVWLIGSALGIGLSAAVSVLHLVIAAAAVAALVAYSFRLKKVVLAGNLLVALLVATSLIFGSLVAGSITAGLYAAVFAFLLTLVREIVKDAADERGDLALEARTLAIVHGRATAVGAASGITSFAVLLTPLPFLISGYSTLYLSVVLIADVILLWAMWSAWSADERGLDRSSALLKWAMIAGMAALAAAHALE